jgi:F0F1-type ATP synthase membrane subunit a
MIQRIQSLYLILSAILQGLGLTFYPKRLLFSAEEVVYSHHLTMLIVFILLTLGPLIVVFLFKNRQLQFVLNRLLIAANLVVWAIHVVGYIKLETADVTQTAPMFLYLLYMLFLVLANKAIKRDEDLVRASDRIR